jgi:hypothetical protein
MTHHLLVVVDDAPPVAGEQAARRDGVQVTPRIHAVATRHAQSLARFAIRAAAASGRRRHPRFRGLPRSCRLRLVASLDSRLLREWHGEDATPAMLGDVLAVKVPPFSKKQLVDVT